MRRSMIAGTPAHRGKRFSDERSAVGGSVPVCRAVDRAAAQGPAREGAGDVIAGPGVAISSTVSSAVQDPDQRSHILALRAGRLKV